ncbi:MAG: hypothetical protein V4803_15100 [Burkholderia gladioli]
MYDQIDVVGVPDLLLRVEVGQHQRGGATADEGNLLQKFRPHRDGNGLDHRKVVVDGRHVSSRTAPAVD